MIKEILFQKFTKMLTLKRFNSVMARSVVKPSSWDDFGYISFNPVGGGTSK